jgi:DNA-binding response OmpR family regulator
MKKAPVILLVEDEAQLRFLLAKILRDDGYEVFEAAHGKEGLEIAQLMHLDLVVTDLMMPEMEGVPFIQAMQQTEFGRDARYVILTAMGKRKDFEGVIPFEDFLEKPLEAEEIVSRIRAALTKIPARENSEVQKNDSPSAGIKRPDLGGATDLQVAQDVQMLAADKSMDTEEDKKKNEQLSLNDGPGGKGKKEEHRVMIAETSEMVYQELLKTFSAQGYPCKQITTEAQCLEMCKTYQPRIILLNAAFGVSGAKALAFQIKKISQVKTAPILIYEKIGSMDTKIGTSSGQGETSFTWDREGEALIQRAFTFLR